MVMMMLLINASKNVCVSKHMYEYMKNERKKERGKIL